MDIEVSMMTPQTSSGKETAPLSYNHDGPENAPLGNLALRESIRGHLSTMEGIYEAYPIPG